MLLSAGIVLEVAVVMLCHVVTIGVQYLSNYFLLQGAMGLIQWGSDD